MEVLSLCSNLDLISPNKETISLDLAYRKCQKVKNEIGVSRVGEIGRFVGHGIYVCQATRPNLFQHFNIGINTGAQGKGYSRKQAYISAVMEAAENFCAEPRTPQMIHGSYRELKKHHPIAEPSQFIHRSFKSTIRHDEMIMWSWALHCESSQQVLIPSELVYVFHIPELYNDRPIFPSSSAGLAAGFDNYTATMKAISEIIEQHYRGITESFDVKIEGLINDFEVSQLVNKLPSEFNERYETNFFVISAHKAKSNIPFVMCFMGDENKFSIGWGLNVDPLKAIQSAHLEAFQSWATQISGVRENMNTVLDSGPEPKPSRAYLKNFDRVWPDKKTLSSKDFLKRYSTKLLSEKSEIEILRKFLRENGFDNIYLVNLSREGLSCSVVKAVVPKLSLSLDVHVAPSHLSKLTADKLVAWQYLIPKPKRSKRLKK